MSRKWFKKKYPSGSCLRDLANKIATMPLCSVLGSITPAPYNFLANGAASGWTSPPVPPLPPPPPFSLVTPPLGHLQAWKSSGPTGFNATLPPAQGLSLLFDPFVDASLFGVYSAPAKPGGTTVVVISDYDTAENVHCELRSLSPGSDWAESYTSQFFGKKGTGTSGDNLRKVIIGSSCGLGAYPSNEAFEKALVDGFQKTGILLWNYFPYLRGLAASGSGFWARMLGTCHRPALYKQLDELLCDFLRCVGATKLVIACSADLWGPCGSHPVLRGCFPRWLRIRHPQNWHRSAITPGAGKSTLPMNIATLKAAGVI